MSGEPQVSVVMGVYNAERFLRAAVESVLGQTLRDVELIAVDDGSTDASPQILASFDDPRVRVLRQPANRGHPAALNRGWRAARAPLIARLDADDVAEPQRLERQVAAMRDRPELDVLGTWTTEIDEDGRTIGRFTFPPSEPLIRWAMTVTNVVYHPSVIMRRTTLEALGGYDESVECADDYDLFTRVLMGGGRVGVLPERLLRYRRTPGQISHSRVEQQREEAAAVRRRYIGWLVGEEPSPDLVEAVAALQVARGAPPGADTLLQAVPLLRRIRRRCAGETGAGEARQMERQSREALLYHTARLREQRRTREAWRLWREAQRCGPDAWRRRAVWGEAMRLVRAGGGGASLRDARALRRPSSDVRAGAEP